MSCHALHQSYTLPFGIFMPHLVKIIKIVKFCLMACNHRSFRILLPHLDWPGCVSWSNVGQNSGKFSEHLKHIQHKWKQMFFQDNLERGRIHASLTKTNVPNSSLDEVPPDHHYSSSKVHRWCETLRLIGLPSSLSNYRTAKCWPKINIDLALLCNYCGLL